MEQKRLIKTYFLDIVLGVLIIIGFSSFWLMEPSNFFRWAVAALLLFSLWQAIKKDNGALLFVAGFIASTLLFRISDIGYIPSWLAAVIMFALIVFLFAYRRVKRKNLFPLNSLFSIYNSLLGLLVAEIFYILIYFPIEAKNKSILIVLFLWFYDECFEAFEEKRLSKQFVVTFGIIFIILFIALIFSFPFQPGL